MDRGHWCQAKLLLEELGRVDIEGLSELADRLRVGATSVILQLRDRVPMYAALFGEVAYQPKPPASEFL